MASKLPRLSEAESALSAATIARIEERARWINGALWIVVVWIVFTKFDGWIYRLGLFGDFIFVVIAFASVGIPAAIWSVYWHSRSLLIRRAARRLTANTQP